MFKVSSLTAVAVFSLSSAAVQFDPPDLSLEFQMHQRFLTTKGLTPNPVSGASENYRLQRGETLWTLSEMLYGDGQYWPRVWQQNRAITNPHLVRQGHMLQFILGSEDQTPAFRFSEEDDDANGVELTAGPTQNPIVEIPPPEVPPKPVIKVPSSFPEWQSVFRPAEDQFVDDRELGKPVGEFANRMYLNAYAQETPLQPIGAFLESDTEATLAVENQYVFVKLEKGVGRPGMRLLVVKDIGPLKKVNSEIQEKIIGNVIQVYGEVELTEETPSNFKKFRDNEDFQAFRALVTRSIGLTTRDTALIEGRLQIVDTTNKGSPGATEAFIIGSGNSTAGALYGEGDLVFLNKGSSHGLEAGQLLSVFADRRARYRNTAVRYSPVRTGTLKIVKVTPQLATALVISAREGLIQGDQVRDGSAKGSAAEKIIPVQKGGPSAAKVPQLEDAGDEIEEEVDGESEMY